MTFRRLPSFALPLLLAACANDIRVSADWDPASDLASRKTFAWAPGKEDGLVAPGGHSAELRSAFYRARVRRAVEGELLATGHAEAAADRAQLWVAWEAASETRHESETVAFRQRRWYDDPWGVDRYETRDYTHEEQTLTVRLSDPKTGSILWTGSVRAPEVSNDPQGRERRIRELVHRLFEKLPKPPVE